MRNYTRHLRFNANILLRKVISILFGRPNDEMDDFGRPQLVVKNRPLIDLSVNLFFLMIFYRKKIKKMYDFVRFWTSYGQ